MQYDQGPAVLDTYTSDEQIIGKWINGKPLYRRVIETTANNQDKVVSLTWFNISTHNVVRFSVCANSNFVMMFPDINSSGTMQGIAYIEGNGDLHIKTSRGSVKTTVIIEYWKNAD